MTTDLWHSKGFTFGPDGDDIAMQEFHVGEATAEGLCLFIDMASKAALMLGASLERSPQPFSACCRVSQIKAVSASISRACAA